MPPSGTKVSVVMIFYNSATYIEASMRSVLEQTYPHVELVMVDDGGADSSLQIVNKIAAEQPGRVAVARHPGGANLGMSASRNRGVEVATGEYIGYLDSDDIWAPEHIENELALLRAHPEARAVCGRAVEWRSWQGKEHLDHRTPVPFAHGVVVRPPDMLTAILRFGHLTTPICCLLAERDLLVSLGGSDPSFRSMFEDQVLLAKIYLSTPVVCSAATTALYRIHDQSSTALAERGGSYNPAGPNSAELRYLTWLRQRPEVVADEDLIELVDDRIADCGSSTLLRQRYIWARRRIMYSLPDRAQAVVKKVRAPGSKRLIRQGLLKRVQPVSRDFGYDRGEPVDRYYISAFLDRHRSHVRGRVLEIGDDSYTKEFGGSHVDAADVFSAPEAPDPATWRGDLATAHDIPGDHYDCVVITQTLQFVRDVPGTLATLHRILKPGGVVLATVPGLSAIADVDWNFTWHWLFAPLGVRTLFADEFGERNVDVSTWGNVASAAAFLYGLAVDELSPRQLDVHDEQYPVIISIRAGKPAH